MSLVLVMPSACRVHCSMHWSPLRCFPMSAVGPCPPFPARVRNVKTPVRAKVPGSEKVTVCVPQKPPQPKVRAKAVYSSTLPLKPPNTGFLQGRGRGPAPSSCGLGVGQNRLFFLPTTCLLPG